MCPPPPPPRMIGRALCTKDLGKEKGKSERGVE